MTEIKTESSNERAFHAILAQGEGRIRPRARLIRTLGAELISSEIVAVIELVRNCYDADASKAYVRFRNPHQPNRATLEISDNGHGMSREVLLGPWLEPATAHKSGHGSGTFSGTRSPQGRRRLGSKGVGRFATQRLGNRLQLVTSTGEGVKLEADFDWASLDSSERYLDQLRIPWRALNDPDAPCGTSLRVHALRDHWTHDRFDKLRLALGRLVGPGLGPDGFEIHLDIDGVSDVVRPAIADLPAMYTIQGSVDDEGRCEIQYEDLSGKTETWARNVFWPDAQEAVCGPFEFELKAWDLDRDAMQFFMDRHSRRFGLRELRRLIRDHSGVSLYRDRFRILPYGEPDNDWLRLDRRRVNNPTLRLSNNQILGRVLLSADRNPMLRDQTNREGLVANDAYQHLQTVVLELMSYLENRRFAARRALSLGSKSSARALPHMNDKHDDHVDALLERISSDGASSPKTVENLRVALDEQRQATADHVSQYAGLATNGQLAGLVFTQIQRELKQLESELRNIVSEVDDAEVDEDVREDLAVSFDKVDRLMGRMKARMEKLDPLANLRKGRRRVQTNLLDCITDVTEAFADEMALGSIVWGIQLDPNTQRTTVATDPTVIQQVVAILLDNAIYWLGTVDHRRELFITVSDQGFTIQDNGPGVSLEASLQLFEPWFSTKPDAPGMGLALARDLLRTIGADIRHKASDDETVFEVCLTRR